MKGYIRENEVSLGIAFQVPGSMLVNVCNLSRYILFIYTYIYVYLFYICTRHRHDECNGGWPASDGVSRALDRCFLKPGMLDSTSVRTHLAGKGGLL